MVYLYNIPTVMDIWIYIIDYNRPTVHRALLACRLACGRALWSLIPELYEPGGCTHSPLALLTGSNIDGWSPGVARIHYVCEDTLRQYLTAPGMAVWADVASPSHH